MDIPDQTGRTVVVTGASSGLGQVVARRLQAAGAHVIAAVRTPAKAPEFEARQVDLGDLDSVRAFADGLHDDGRTIDVLVNNAGLGHHTRQLSPQGFEATFAVNFLGHFALTGRLLDLMRTDSRARIVHVGSNLYRRMKTGLPLDDLAAERGYFKGRAYVASKLANLIFGTELDRRLQAAGHRVRSLTAHPGLANTPMNSQLPTRTARTLMAVAQAAIGRPAERAAIPLLYAAVDPDARPGVFLGPHLRKSDDHVYADALVPPADDPALAERLWTVAETATGVRFDLGQRIDDREHGRPRLTAP
ncbi:SDR family NAD(P)-dependent oxidoreductase [Dactylosporangium sp. NPDC051541]|uniref:SDR family NAD(P)-dependent oxidoreductase n=1 Tax=Dactylosporangium sp. NPDC051541 TaxID=3363977 RepID=UPI0037918646